MSVRKKKNCLQRKHNLGKDERGGNPTHRRGKLTRMTMWGFGKRITSVSQESLEKGMKHLNFYKENPLKMKKHSLVTDFCQSS